MEIFLIIITLIGMVLILSKIKDSSREVHGRFDALHTELHQLKNELAALRARVTTAVPPKETAAPKLAPEVYQQPEPKPAPIIYPVEPKPVTPIPAKPTEEYISAALKAEPTERKITQEFIPAPSRPQPVPKEPELTFTEKFLRNNPDLEKFIGENLINKIGIAILVLGIGYFVKYAIDQEWINEIGRVFIGILAGGLLIGLAHRLRHTVSAFSSVLVGGGLAVLYFTIAIAFHEYHIFSQTAAFLIMVVITGFSILLSISYNRVELAVLSLLGGFGTPFMLSTGEGNYQVLFTYVLILNVGMLVLAYLKNWKIINYIAYFFTVVLYGGWLSTRVINMPNAPYMGALFFGALYYLIFFLMNIINNLKEKVKFTAPEITILISNTWLFYSAGMLILSNIQEGLYRGLFTVLMGLINFVFAYTLYKNQRVDRNLIFLLIGLVITFISLAVPIQLEGNYITMFWALEAVLLLWLAQKSGLKLIAASSIVVTGLMVISLLMDWNNIYLQNEGTTSMRVLVNKGFITSFIAVISLLATRYLLKNQSEPINFRRSEIGIQSYNRLLGIGVLALLYFSLALELAFHLPAYVSSEISQRIITGTFNFAFLVFLFLLTRYKQKPAFTGAAIALGLLGIVAYLIYFNPAVLELLEQRFLGGRPNFIGFPFHYLSLILILVILYFIFQNLRTPDAPATTLSKLLTWAGCFTLAYIASSELLFHVVYFNLPVDYSFIKSKPNLAVRAEYYTLLIRQTNKVGFPILWGLLAFIFMLIGLKQKIKSLRIIALTLFSITLAKLFTYDIRGISEGGKIAAFISLGVLLLVISFMYQNIKRLILTDEASAATTEKEPDPEV